MPFVGPPDSVATTFSKAARGSKHSWSVTLGHKAESFVDWSLSSFLRGFAGSCRRHRVHQSRRGQLLRHRLSRFAGLLTAVHPQEFEPPFLLLKANVSEGVGSTFFLMFLFVEKCATLRRVGNIVPLGRRTLTRSMDGGSFVSCAL